MKETPSPQLNDDNKRSDSSSSNVSYEARCVQRCLVSSHPHIHPINHVTHSTSGQQSPENEILQSQPNEYQQESNFHQNEEIQLPKQAQLRQHSFTYPESNNIHDILTEMQMIHEQQQWNQQFEELKAYHKKHGHSDVPNGYEENRKLGLWVDLQRKCYMLCFEEDTSMVTSTSTLSHDTDSKQKLTALTEERIKMLRTLAFKFPVIDDHITLSNKYEQRWNRHFEDLKTYHKKHGHSDVPYRYKEDPSLGSWCKTQRRNIKKFWEMNELDNDGNNINTSESNENTTTGKRKRFSSMTQERIAKLRTVYFKFPDPTQQMTYEQRWDHWFQELEEYYDEHEHSNVPINYDKNPQLGTWVYRQRKHYISFMELKQLENDNSSVGQDETTPQSNSNASTGKIKSSCPMTQEMIDKLHTLDFIFPYVNDHNEMTSMKQIMTNEQKWNKRFEELKEYFVKNGHSNMPVHYTENVVLGSWVYNQRTYYYKEFLKLDQLEQLQKNDNSSIKHGSTSTSSNNNITNRKKKLQERINKLCTVAFKFTNATQGMTNEQKWNERFEELKAFHKEHGHSDVPVRYKENTKLGWWVNNQRKYYKTFSANCKEKPCPLTEDRIKKLHTVDFKVNSL